MPERHWCDLLSINLCRPFLPCREKSLNPLLLAHSLVRTLAFRRNTPICSQWKPTGSNFAPQRKLHAICGSLIRNNRQLLGMQLHAIHTHNHTLWFLKISVVTVKEEIHLLNLINLVANQIKTIDTKRGCTTHLHCLAGASWDAETRSVNWEFRIRNKLLYHAVDGFQTDLKYGW